MSQLRYISACEHGLWHLMIHPKEDNSSPKPVIWKCRSWRHAGECRMYKGAQDFCRVRDAIEDWSHWVYVVLTFSQKEWWDWKAQYYCSAAYWSCLRLRLRRKYGKIPYIQTWERHKKQGIHANVLLTHWEIHQQVSLDYARNGGNHDAIFQDKNSWVKAVLSPMAESCGFGPRCSAQPLSNNNNGAMANYLVKLATELTGAGVKNQIPVDAPPHFRRLRASPKLLPPVMRGDMSGYLVCLPMERILPDGEIIPCKPV